MPQMQKRTQNAQTGEGQADKYREVVECLNTALEQLDELREKLSDSNDQSIVTQAQWADLQGKLMALTSLVREINMARVAARGR